MSRKNNLTEDNGADAKRIGAETNKRKFKKSDILVFAICLVVSTLIWAYASNVAKNEEEKELSKEVIQEVVESGMKNNESVAANEESK